jgi:hypothetical protein
MKKLVLLIFIIALVACQKSEVYITEILKDGKLVTDDTIIEQLIAIDEQFILTDLEIHVLEHEIDSYNLYHLTSKNTRLNYLILYGDETMTFQLAYLDRLYELDSDGDGFKELFFINDIGSGLRIPSGVHVDFKDMSLTTNIIERSDNKISNDGLAFKVVKGKIMVYPYYYEFDRMGQEAIGELIIDETITIK